jgi:predicted dinucleotide-binding enzyme
MQIGIIGAGNIGGTLGRAWAAADHQIVYGVRHPADPKFDDLRGSGTVGTVAEAVAGAEVVLLALPGKAVADVAAEHAAALAGKIIIDAANVVQGPVLNNLALLAERVPTAKLVRAFSTLGWENFADPQIGGVQVDLFFCGDLGVREVVERLIADVGLRPIYCGDIDAAPALDGMTRLWFALVFGQGYGRRVAFKLLREEKSATAVA